MKLWSRRELPRDVDGAGFVDRDGPADRLVGTLHPRVPDANGIAAGRKSFRAHPAISPGLSGVGVSATIGYIYVVEVVPPGRSSAPRSPSALIERRKMAVLTEDSDRATQPSLLVLSA
jgi:hypothetical protein